MDSNPGTCEDCRKTAPDDVPYRAGIGRGVVPSEIELEIGD